MNAAADVRLNLPMASGVVATAGKTQVAQRLQPSGMRGPQPGGQAILTLRRLIQSDRGVRDGDRLRYSDPIRVEAIPVSGYCALPLAAERRDFRWTPFDLG